MPIFNKTHLLGSNEIRYAPNDHRNTQTGNIVRHVDKKRRTRAEEVHRTHPTADGPLHAQRSLYIILKYTLARMV